jgi:O-acetylserine/cysteine efflux transporter
LTERARQFLVLAGLNVLWAPVNLAVRVATDHGVSPAAVALARWSVLAIVLQLLIRVPAFAAYARFKPLEKGDRTRALLIGACLFAPAHALYYLGLTRGASTVGGTVLNATAPIWVAALAFLLLREKATPRRVAAIAIGFIGAWIVVCGFGLPKFDGDRLGDLFYLGGVILEATATVIGTAIVRRSSGIGYLSNEVMGMIPTLVLLPVLTGGTMPISVTAFSWPALLAVAYLIFLPGLVCFGVWNATVERVPLSTMVVTIMLQPPLSALLAWALNGETLAPTALVGSALVLAALAVVATERAPTPQTPDP